MRHRQDSKATFAVALVAAQLPAMVGNASPAVNSQPPADRRIVDVPIDLIWTDGKKLRPALLQPADLYLRVAVNPGGFQTNGVAPYIETFRVARDYSIRWDLDDLTKKFARKATPANAAAAPGFEVTPKEARLVRLLPGLWFNAARTMKLTEGFYDADTRNTLRLVYFDRPCHVTGTDMSHQGLTLESVPQVDIQVDAPGWAWIETRKTGPATYIEDRVPSPHPVLLITPYDKDLFRRAQEGTDQSR